MLGLATSFIAGLIAMPLIRAIWNVRESARVDHLSTVDAMKALLGKPETPRDGEA